MWPSQPLMLPPHQWRLALILDLLALSTRTRALLPRSAALARFSWCLAFCSRALAFAALSRRRAFADFSRRTALAAFSFLICLAFLSRARDLLFLSPLRWFSLAWRLQMPLRLACSVFLLSTLLRRLGSVARHLLSLVLMPLSTHCIILHFWRALSWRARVFLLESLRQMVSRLLTTEQRHFSCIFFC